MAEGFLLRAKEMPEATKDRRFSSASVGRSFGLPLARPLSALEKTPFLGFGNRLLKFVLPLPLVGRQVSPKQFRGFARLGKMSAVLFFPQQLAVAADFKNATTAGNQFDFLVGLFRDLSRHTVGFGEVVSHLTVFDFDSHGGSIHRLTSAAKSN